MTRNLNRVMWLAFAAAVYAVPASAASEQVAITVHTDLYQDAGAENNFALGIGLTTTATVSIDGGYGKKSFEVGPATFNPDTQAIECSYINTQVSKNGLVTVYTDPKLIDYLDFEGLYITSVDMNEATNLDILIMDHNKLEALDLTPFTRLQSISLTDNPFNKSPLIVGGNKPDLSILTLDIIDNMSPSFNLSDYPSLVSFSAWNNRGLKTLDPTGCPELVRLSIDGTDVSSIDLSNNKKLRILNLTDTRIVDFDLSILPELEQFYCTHQSGTINPDMKVRKLDVSKNPKLAYLYAAGNELTDIDLTHNPELMMLNVCHNKLTGIDLSKNDNLYEVNISFNNMDFNTMPQNPGTWDYVTQQNAVPVDYSYPVGGKLDLKSKVVVAGAETYAALLKPDADNSANYEELDSTYYTYADGVVTFLKEIPDSVYMEYYTPLFPDAPLQTTKFVVKKASDFGKPNLLATWIGDASGAATNLYIGVAGASAENPKSVYVDFGDGVEQKFEITSPVLPAQANVKGASKSSGSMRLLADDGVFVTAFGMHGTLYSFNSDKMSSLTDLDLSGCSLYAVDLTYNNRLESLNLSDNNLSSINLAGPSDALNKVRLGDINLAGNNLSEFHVPDNRTLINLDLSRNKIETISFRDADNLKSLNVAGNLFSDIDLHYCNKMLSLDASGNRLTQISLPDTVRLTTVNLSDNCLTLATLPAPSLMNGASYTYAPQGKIGIPTKGPGVDLSSQALDIDGNKTSFAWFKADGTPCKEGVDYTVTGGRTRFIDVEMGKVYCEITNGAFPGLTILTSEIEAASNPTNLIASFKTPVGDQKVGLSLAAASGNPALYIDWKGNGDLEQYLLKDTYTLYQAVTTKNADVKVYTYGPEERITVFSMGGATITDVDFSKMTDLICLSLSNGGFRTLKMPEAPGLRELTLSGDAISSIDLTAYKNLYSLDLSYNELESFDLTPFKNLGIASLSYNTLNEIKLGNPGLWGLALDNNNFTEIDLSGVPQLNQVSLSHNELSTIDVSKLNALRGLTLDYNFFNYSTLPLPRESWPVYVYRNQAQIEVTPDAENKVDLSCNKASQDGTQTVYKWYVGDIVPDEEGNPSGTPFDEAGYTLDDGVTTFVKGGKNLICMMTNASFSGMYMFSNFINVEVSGVDETLAPSDLKVTADDGRITVACMRDITVALYALDGTSLGSRSTASGEAVFDSLPSGIYILSTPAGAYKLKL